jgi:hypothetical protein
MPAPEDNGVDLRPIGATAGAALPAASLLEYLLVTLPKYKKLINDAPDWTLANGNVDVAQALKTLKPGDLGLSGLQQSRDGNLVNFLIQGSGAASGGPGMHGQMVGPYIQAPHALTNTPEGGKPPPLSFLVNDAGEVYSPGLATNRKGFISNAPNAERYMAFEGGGDKYGLMKARLNALSRQIQEAKTTGADASKLVARRDKLVKNFKNFLTTERTTPTGGTYAAKGGLREFFEGTPQAKMRRVETNVRALADNPASPESLAKKERLKALADLFRRRGTKSSPALADAITKAVDEVGMPQGHLARSKLFKPKAFERLIPTLHHGGAMLDQVRDPLFHLFETLPEAAQREIAGRNGVSLNILRQRVRENQKAMAAGRLDAKKRPWKFNSGDPHMGIDNVYDDAMKDRSQLFPKGYYAEQPRGTIYARMADNIDESQLAKSLNVETNKGYASSAAIGAGTKEVMGLNMLRRRFPWLQKIPFIGGRGIGTRCWGNHCGSMPSAVLSDIGAVKPQLSHMDVLPSTLLTRPGAKILGITNKPIVQKGLKLMARNRTLLGLGATGLMGAAGYGAGALGNTLKAPPAKPLPPKLDPHMFANAMKLLQPQQRA